MSFYPFEQKADLSAGYINAVMENLNSVAQIIDPFHVVKLMNDKITQVRRTLAARTSPELLLSCRRQGAS